MAATSASENQTLQQETAETAERAQIEEFVLHEDPEAMDEPMRNAEESQPPDPSSLLSEVEVKPDGEDSSDLSDPEDEGRNKGSGSQHDESQRDGESRNSSHPAEETYEGGTLGMDASFFLVQHKTEPLSHIVWAKTGMPCL